MALTNEQRKEIWARFMSDLSAVPEMIGDGTINKHQLRDVVDAIDDWIDANAASFNNALPEPGKSQLSGKQKYRLFKMVLIYKYEVI